jgi:hypothetical protein
MVSKRIKSKSIKLEKKKEKVRALSFREILAKIEDYCERNSRHNKETYSA